jgi:hypothetical protein
MGTPATDLVSPLTLCEQLDAMLLGWLERRARMTQPPAAEARARALVSVEDRHVPEVEAFCARWDLGVRPTPRNRGGWTMLAVAGRLLPVEGLTELAALLRGEGGVTRPAG